MKSGYISTGTFLAMRKRGTSSKYVEKVEIEKVESPRQSVTCIKKRLRCTQPSPSGLAVDTPRGPIVRRKEGKWEDTEAYSFEVCEAAILAGSIVPELRDLNWKSPASSQRLFSRVHRTVARRLFSKLIGAVHPSSFSLVPSRA